MARQELLICCILLFQSIKVLATVLDWYGDHDGSSLSFGKKFFLGEVVRGLAENSHLPL